jgi:hypothetical protein
VAGPGPGTAALQLRLRPLRARPPPWHRHRGAAGQRRGGTGRRGRLLCRNGADRWTHDRNPDARRLLGDAGASGRAGGGLGRGGRGGSRGWVCRIQRRGRAAGAVRAPRRSASCRPAGVSRSAALPAAAGATALAGRAAHAGARSGVRHSAASRDCSRRADPCRRRAARGTAAAGAGAARADAARGARRGASAGSARGAYAQEDGARKAREHYGRNTCLRSRCPTACAWDSVRAADCPPARPTAVDPSVLNAHRSSAARPAGALRPDPADRL